MQPRYILKSQDEMQLMYDNCKKRLIPGGEMEAAKLLLKHEIVYEDNNFYVDIPSTTTFNMGTIGRVIKTASNELNKSLMISREKPGFSRLIFFTNDLNIISDTVKDMMEVLLRTSLSKKRSSNPRKTVLASGTKTTASQLTSKPASTSTTPTTTTESIQFLNSLPEIQALYSLYESDVLENGRKELLRLLLQHQVTNNVISIPRSTLYSDSLISKIIRDYTINKLGYSVEVSKDADNFNLLFRGDTNITNLDVLSNIVLDIAKLLVLNSLVPGKPTIDTPALQQSEQTKKRKVPDYQEESLSFADYSQIEFEPTVSSQPDVPSTNSVTKYPTLRSPLQIHSHFQPDTIDFDIMENDAALSELRDFMSADILNSLQKR